MKRVIDVRNRFWPVLVTLAAVIVLVSLWRHPIERGQSTVGSEQVIAETALRTNITQTTSHSEVAVAGEGRLNPPSPVGLNDREKPEAFKQSIEERNSPISFNGVVVDQAGSPVSGVKIHAVIRQWYVRNTGSFDIAAHFVSVERETAADGRFEIHGEKGDGFGIELAPRGDYSISPKAPRAFGPSSGSPQSPIIFTVWKRGTPAKLVAHDQDTRIPYDGTPVTFDLITEQKSVGESAGGDLQIILKRTPLKIPFGYKDAVEWHATINALEGGVALSDDEFMFLAPEGAYAPRIQIDMPADATNWVNKYAISFCAKTRNGGLYSRVKLEFRVDSPKSETGLTITSAANPDGSRNLQQ